MNGSRSKALRKLAVGQSVNAAGLQLGEYLSKVSGMLHQKLWYPPGSFMRVYRDLKKRYREGRCKHHDGNQRNRPNTCQDGRNHV